MANLPTTSKPSPTIRPSIDNGIFVWIFNHPKLIGKLTMCGGGRTYPEDFSVKHYLAFPSERREYIVVVYHKVYRIAIVLYLASS